MNERSALAAVLGVGRGLQAAAHDALAGALRHVDPGFRIVVGLHLSGAGVLAGAAIVLAGLHDAGALLGVALRSEHLGGGSSEADREQAGESALNESGGFGHD